MRCCANSISAPPRTSVTLPPPRETPQGATVALIERVLVLALLAALLLGVAEVLRPFITAILFGTILAVAAWPLRERLVRAGMARAAAAMTLLALALAVLVLPSLAIAPGLTQQISHGGSHLAGMLAALPPHAPDWLSSQPLVGDQISSLWDDVASGGFDVVGALAPYSARLRGALVAVATGLADSLLQLVLALAVATMAWVHGHEFVALLDDVLHRLGGEAAVAALRAAGGALRSVAYGVVGTAALQGVMMGAGLGLAGVHGAAGFGFITLLLSLSQIGVPLIYALGLGWAWATLHAGATFWAIFLAIWTLLVGASDHVLRPWLISFGGRMPLALVILGVFGGFLSFGFLGLFIGPSLLAVAFSLLAAWRGRGFAAEREDQRVPR